MLKYCYIPHNNNLLLIPDLFVGSTMTCLWHRYWLYDVFTQHNSFHMNKISKKDCLPYKVNYDVISRGALIDWFIVLNIFISLLHLVKLLTTFEHNCCSRAKVTMGAKSNPPPPRLWSSKKPVSDRVIYDDSWFWENIMLESNHEKIKSRTFIMVLETLLGIKLLK